MTFINSWGQNSILCPFFGYHMSLLAKNHVPKPYHSAVILFCIWNRSIPMLFLQILAAILNIVHIFFCWRMKFFHPVFRLPFDSTSRQYDLMTIGAAITNTLFISWVVYEVELCFPHLFAVAPTIQQASDHCWHWSADYIIIFLYFISLHLSWFLYDRHRFLCYKA